MTGYTNEWMNKVGNGRNMQVLRLASSGFQILPFWNISFSFFSESRKTKRYRSIFRTPGPLLYKCVQAAGLDKAKSSIWVSYTYNRNLSPGAITCCLSRCMWAGSCRQSGAEIQIQAHQTRVWTSQVTPYCHTKHLPLNYLQWNEEERLSKCTSLFKPESLRNKV